MKTPRRNILKYVGWGAIAAPIAGLATAVGLGPSVLERQRAAASREGIPLLPEELRRTPAVLNEENAAQPLRALTRYWNDISEKESRAWDDAAGKFNKNPEDMAAVVAFSERQEKYHKAFALAEEAARLPHCDFHYDWSLGATLSVSELTSTKRIGRLLVARARLSSTPERAFADVACIARLSSHIWETPISWAAIDGAGLQSMASRAYIDSLRRFGPCHIARKTLSIFRSLPLPSFSYQGDVVTTLATMRQLREGKLRTEPDTEYAVSVWNIPSDLVSFVGDYWEERLVLYWREFFAILRSTTEIDERERQLKVFEERLSQDNDFQKFLNLVADLLGPVYRTGMIEIDRGLQVQQRFRETALHLLEAKKATGRFPDHPDLPLDPYSDKSLGYRREGESCVLWSVGPNRIDDGGVALSSDKRILDMVLRL